MTKRLRNILIAILSALAVFVCAIMLFTPTFTVSAEETTEDVPKYEMTDGSHSFNTGAALKAYSLGEGEYILGFKLYQNSADHGNFYKFPNEMYSSNVNFHGVQINNEFAYRFSIIKVVDDKEVVLANLYYVFETRADRLGLMVAVDEVSYYREEITLEYDVLSYFGVNSDQLKETSTKYGTRSYNYYNLQNADSINYYYITDKTTGLMPDGSGAMSIALGVNSPNQQYKVKFEYRYTLCSFSGIFADYYDNIKTDWCESDTRSIVGILTNADAAVGLEEFFTYDGALDEASYNKAVELLEGTTEATVFVSYLEPIEGTPFARKVREAVTVPVSADDEDPTFEIVYLDDVLTALGKESIAVFGAAIKSISRPTGSSIDFSVDYWRSFWMRAITTDGKYVDYFSDINKSFETYYYAYVESGVVNEATYEYMWNSLCTKYKDALAPYQDSPGKVYGLWGMAVLPETYTINTFWKECFSTNTTKGEQVTMFSYRDAMTNEQYQALLGIYEYGWLDRVWSAVSGFVNGSTYNADYYLFYAEPGTTSAWIDYTGETEDEEDLKDNPNPGGTIWEEIKDVTVTIGQAISNLWGTISDAGLFMTTGTFIYPLVGVALIAVIIYLVIKYKSSKK